MSIAVLYCVSAAFLWVADMTNSWKRESDVDEWLERMDPTMDPGPPLAPSFNCPFCKLSFPTVATFHVHITDEHSIARPFVLMNGHEPRPRQIVRQRLSQGSIHVHNATSIGISIDGGAMCWASPAELALKLHHCTYGTVSLKLLNAPQRGISPAETSYEMSFFVAEPPQLQKIEKAFMSGITNSTLSMDSIDRFIQLEICAGAGNEYAQGLAKYALGVLVKERPVNHALTTPISVYRDHFGFALEVLGCHRRRVANLISDIIRFSVNDFESAHGGTGCFELDVANSILKTRKMIPVQKSERTSESWRNVCPIDHVTDQVLNTAIHLSSQERWSHSLDEYCRSMLRSEMWDGSDRQKILALWAIVAWSLSAKQHAIEPLQQISAIYPFNAWAGQYLEMVTK